MELLHAIILAVVEGLTEYLPISSTGHLIITSSFLGIAESSFTKDYTVIVQFGAILSVLVLYWRRFLSAREFYYKLALAFLPVAIIGLLVKKKIDVLLGSVLVVAVSMILGGLVLIWIDRWLDRRGHTEKIEDLSLKGSLIIGFTQCLALFPGVSRSAATIIGGLSQRLTRQEAAEFSFLLGVPTLTAATCLKMVKILPTLQPQDYQVLIVGNIISFVIGAISVKAFVGYLNRYGFKWFGYYRIIFGAVLLFLLLSGHNLHDL